MATPQSTLERAEQLAERLLPERTPKKRMLVIVNPYATTVSDRLRNLVVYALESRYAVEAVDTEKPDHATQICREAAAGGLRRGGGLRRRRHGERGRQRPGRLGHPAHLPARAAPPTSTAARSASPATWWTPPSTCCGWPTTSSPARVDLGRVNDRYFTFSSGVGLDASVVERVDAHPRNEGPPRRVVLHLRRHHDLHPAVPGATAPRAGARRRPRARGRDRDRPELRSLHLLRHAGRSASATARRSTPARSG